MTPILEENTIVEVGKYYMFKCAIVEVNMETLFVPVIGIPHKDLSFGPDIKHYHIDGRFTRGRNGIYDTDKNGITNGFVAAEHHDFITANLVDIVLKRIKCKRLTTGANPPFANLWGELTKYALWYNTQLGKSCAGKKCPHLGTVMHEHDGKLICPLHGLHGDLVKQVIIPAA